MIRIALLKKKIFESSDGLYCVYIAKTGKSTINISVRGEQPKILKTVEYKLIGDFKEKNGRKTFVVESWEKIKGRVSYAKSIDTRMSR